MIESLRARWLGAVLLLGCVAAVYHPVVDFGFVTWDDPSYVQHNTQVQRGLSADGLAWALSSARVANWHPLTWASHMLDVELFGDDAGGHHLTSAVLHALTACLLYLAIGRMTGRWGPALCVAALWACHPLRAESVAWISERKDVLSGLLFMLVLLALERHARAPSARRLAWVVVALALGLMAKSMLVTVPAVAWLLAAWPLSRRPGGWWPAGDGEVGGVDADPAVGAARSTQVGPRRSAPVGPGRLLGECGVLLLPCLAVAAVTLGTQGSFGAVADSESLPLSLRWRTAVLAPWTYLRQLVWPADLSFYRPLPDPPPGVVEAGLAAVGLVAVTLLVLVGPLRRQPWWALGWGWFLVMLVPVSGWVQVGGQAAADRYTYLPTIGPTWAAVWSVAALWRRRRWPPRGAALLGALLVGVTIAAARPQAMTWRSSRRLYEHAVAVDPDNGMAHLQLAIVLDRREDPAAGEHFARALALRPTDSKAHAAHGHHRARLGDLSAARDALQRAVSLRPDEFSAWLRLAEVCAESGDGDGRAAALEAAVGLRPHAVEVTLMRAELAVERGDLDGARAVLRAGRERHPEDPRLSAALADVRARRRAGG